MKRLLILGFLLIFLFPLSSVSAEANTNTTLFNDGFEVDISTNWTVSSGGWIRESTGGVGGVKEGSWDGKKPASSVAGNLTTKGVDTFGASKVYISFWYQDNNLDVNGDMRLQYNDSSGNMDTILDMGNSATEDTWTNYVATVTDSQYFHSGFRIRFWGGALASTEAFWVDKVEIIREDDTSPPQYSANASSKATGTTYSQGNNYGFQIGWADTANVDKVFFETNLSTSPALTNFTVALFSGTTSDGTYVINFTDLAAGTYQYGWYANDTGGNMNGTFPALAYTIAQATPSLSVAPIDTVTYPAAVGTGCERAAGDSGSTLTLYRNDTQKATGTSSPQNQTTETLEAAVYNFTCTISATANYTAGTSANNYRTVSQNTTNPMDLRINNGTDYYNQNVTILQGTQTTVNSSTIYAQSGAATLFRDDIAVSNPDTQTLVIGTYKYTANTSGNANYSGNNTGSTYYLTVLTPDSDPPLYFSNASSKPSGTEYNSGNNYGFQIRWTDATGADKVLFETDLNSTPKNFTATLASGTAQDGIYTINFTGIAAGSYTYRWYANDTGGNMNASFPSLTYTITQSSPTLSIGSLSPLTYPSPAQTGCERAAGDPGSTLTLFKNGTNVASGTSNTINETAITLGAGVYNYSCTISATTNYTAGSLLDNYRTVSQNSTNPIKLWFRNSTNQYINQNMTITYENNSNSTAMIVYQQAGILNLYYDDVLRTNDYNGTNLVLGAGLYKVTANTSGNTNYTGNSTTYYIRVNQKNANVQVSPSSQTITYETSVTQYCTDNTLLDCNIYRNGTLITNNTNIILGNATYAYVANITDTANYTNWQATSTLKVNRKNLNIYTAFNGTANADRTYNYPDVVNATGWKDSTLNSEGTLVFYRNGTVVSGSDVQRFGNTTYNYTLDFTASNYTNNKTTYYARVNKGTPDVKAFIDDGAINKTITYGTSATAKGNSTTTITPPDFNLYANNATNYSLFTASGNPSSIANIFGAGTYNMIYNTSGNENWTSASNGTIYLIVNKMTINLAMSPQTQSIIYGASVTQYCSNNVTTVSCLLYRNSSLITNNTAIVLAAAVYNFTANITDTQNYTVYQNSSLLTVSKGTLSLTISSNGTQTYLYTSTAQGSETNSGDADITYWLTRNKTLVDSTSPWFETMQFGAGVYNYTFNTSGTSYENWTANASGVSVLLIISQNNTNPIKLFFRNETGEYLNQNMTILYGNSSNSTAVLVYQQSGTLDLYYNDLLRNNYNNATLVLAGGLYKITANTSGNTNYTGNTTTYYIRINKRTLSGSISSPTVTYPSPLVATSSESNYGDGDVAYQTVCGNIISSDLTGTFQFGAGTYDCKLNTTEATFENYSSSASIASSTGTINQNNTNPMNMSLGYGAETYWNQNLTVGQGTQTTIQGYSIYSQSGTALLWRDGVSVSNPDTQTLAIGYYEYKVNTSGNANYSSNNTGMTFSVNITEPQNPPSWSANATSLSSPQTYSATTAFGFEVKWDDNADTNGYNFSYFEHNFTGTKQNYTTSRSGNISYYNITGIPGGTHYFRFYVNDSRNNWNRTDEWAYVINLASPSMIVAPLATVTYPTAVGTGCQRVTGDSSSILTLYRNGTLAASGATSPQNQSSQSLDAGVWNFTCVISASQNYSSMTSANNYLTVNQNSTNPIKIFLKNITAEYLNQNLTATYPAPANATAYLAYTQSGTLNLYRNDILQNSENGINITLGAGLHKITANTTGNQNYSANTTTFYINVSKGARTVSLTLDGQSSDIIRVYNGTSALYTVSASESNAGDADATYTLYENSVSTGQSGSLINYNINRGNNTFIFVYNSSASENWTTISLSRTFKILKGIANLSITGSQTVSYPSATTVTGIETNTGDSDISYLLYRNESVNLGTNTETNTLGAGAYGYTFNSTAGENWTANSTGVATTVTVSKGATETKLWMNGTRGNVTYTKNNYANFTVESNASGKTVYLYANITGWVLQSGTTTLNNYTNLTTEGTYNITGYFPGDENYSASSETWFAKVIGKFIELDLVEPTGTKLVQEGQTFVINATIKCKLENCGEINATPRYNEIPIPESSGTIYVNAGQQLKNCTLNADESCAVSWSVSTTTIGTFNIDVNASGGASNETSDATLSVYRVVIQVVSTPSGGTTVQEGGVSKKESPLMDLEITNFTPKVGAGEKIRFEINLTNVGGKEMFDAVIHKRIKKNDTIIVEKVDTRAMTSRLLFKDDMDIPANLEPGKYFLELYVEYVNKTASALVTFDIKKTCLAMQDISYSLMTKSNVMYSDSLDSITLKFDNICDKDLKNAVLYLDGNKIDIGTIKDNYSKTVEFDKYGMHRLSIEYDGGEYVAEFNLAEKVSGTGNVPASSWANIIIAIIIAGAGILSIYLFRKMKRLPKKKETPEEPAKMKVVTEPYKAEEVILNIKAPEPKKEGAEKLMVMTEPYKPEEIIINIKELKEKIKSKIREKIENRTEEGKNGGG